jgi:hypothetical protein
MKKVFGAIGIVLLSLSCMAFQLTLPLGGNSSGPAPKKTRPTSKMLNGTVTDSNDQPITGAVVYLKNMKTLAVKSFFTDQAGAYRFPQLPLNTDYELYAEKDGKKSSVKSISQFDDRYTPTINMKIDVNK